MRNPTLDHLLQDACCGCETFLYPCGVQIWWWTRQARRSLVCTLRLKDPSTKGTIFQLHAANLNCEAKWLNRFGFFIHASIRSRHVASELAEFLQDNTIPYFSDSSTSRSVFILRDLWPPWVQFFVMSVVFFMQMQLFRPTWRTCQPRRFSGPTVSLDLVWHVHVTLTGLSRFGHSPP